MHASRDTDAHGLGTAGCRPGWQTAAVIARLFVYGTLLPGDVRWPHLEPFVVDEGWRDTVAGRLYDTGQDYPAAIVDERALAGGTILGHTFALMQSTLGRALDLLDEIEGVVGGRYVRRAVTTGSGSEAWMYEYGSGLGLVEIESGDWFAHRPPHLAVPRTDRPVPRPAS